MRKIVFLFVFFIITLLLTSCKSIIPAQSLRDNIKYIEYNRLRGQTNEFFIEVVVGKRQLESFVKITALPKKMNSPEKITYIYGENKGELEKKDGKLTGELKADMAKDFIVIKTKTNDAEVVELIPLTSEVDAEKVLDKAIYHIENALGDKNNSMGGEIEMKIIADMHGNAYIFVAFEDQGRFYSLLFDAETDDIVAEYNL